MEVCESKLIVCIDEPFRHHLIDECLPQEVLADVVAFFETNVSIIDIGCGDWQFLKHLYNEEHTKNVHYYGYDLLPTNE